MTNGNVQILFGANSIKKVYEESLREDTLDIVCLATSYQGVIGDFFDKDYAPRLYRQVRTREIIADTAGNRADAQGKDQARNAVKFLKGTSETDMILSRDRAVLISYNQESPLAVVIGDPELVSGLRAQFEALWASL
jgi:hypothetical protein